MARRARCGGRTASSVRQADRRACSGMPLIVVSMLVGRSDEQKRRLVDRLTQVMEEVAGADGQNVNVIIHEVRPEDWGLGGVPLSEPRSRPSPDRR